MWLVHTRCKVMIMWDGTPTPHLSAAAYVITPKGPLGNIESPKPQRFISYPTPILLRGFYLHRSVARSIYHSDMVWRGEVWRKRCNASLFCTRYSTRFLSCGTQCNAGSIKYSEEGLNLLSSVILQEAGLNLLSILSNCIVGSGLVGHLHKVTNNKGKTNEILMLLSFLNLYLKGTCSINWGI